MKRSLVTEPRVRITRAEALRLLRDASLTEVGRHAFYFKRQLYGDTVTYVRNCHVNPTNLCVYSCRFCDFAAKPGDPHAYSLTEDDILCLLSDPALREVHVVGGLWHTWGLDRSLELVRRIRSARPDLWIKAYTAVEVAYFARMNRCDYASVISAMRDAGVDAMPGGGAEVLSERLHHELFRDKIGPDEWLAVHKTAHILGMSSNCTLLFGHIETDEEIVEHLIRLRTLQDETGGFSSFIPLAYQPGAGRLVPRLVSAPRCLRVIAVARLVLDNIPHVKAYWPTLQLETAAAALSFGADDLDGTLGRERIMQLAQTAAPAAISARHAEQLIRDAGQSPVERDGAFHPVVSSVASCKGVA